MTVQPASLKALVVEDDSANRLSLVSLLLKIGFTQIDEATTARQAEEAMQQKNYDIVFLDWNLPDSSGFSILEGCRSATRYDNCAFVIVSGETTDHYIIEALKAGATSYIVKPLIEESFIHHLNKVFTWLSRKREAQENIKSHTA